MARFWNPRTGFHLRGTHRNSQRSQPWAFSKTFRRVSSRLRGGPPPARRSPPPRLSRASSPPRRRSPARRARRRRRRRSRVSEARATPCRGASVPRARGLAAAFQILGDRASSLRRRSASAGVSFPPAPLSRLTARPPGFAVLRQARRLQWNFPAVRQDRLL